MITKTKVFLMVLGLIALAAIAVTAQKNLADYEGGVEIYNNYTLDYQVKLKPFVYGALTGPQKDWEKVKVKATTVGDAKTPDMHQAYLPVKKLPKTYLPVTAHRTVAKANGYIYYDPKSDTLYLAGTNKIYLDRTFTVKFKNRFRLTLGGPGV